MFSKVTRADKKLMDAQSNLTLASWYCSLNIFDWPQELSNHRMCGLCRFILHHSIHLTDYYQCKHCGQKRYYQNDHKHGQTVDKAWLES